MRASGSCWILLKVSITILISPSTSGKGSIRPNVVKEVPGLDVGPLVSVTVKRGDIARLPCRHPRYAKDTVSLILWYLNHTSRPFLSYDARDKTDRGEVTKGRSSRMSLEAGGTILVIHEVREKDQAEYRCRVHFRLSPTWTQRLLLNVPDRVWDVELTDSTGRPLEGSTVGPMAEGSTLTLTCQTNHGHAKVVNLVWLLEGVDIDNTWAEAEEGVAINQLTISELEQRHRNAHLTCRLTLVDSTHSHVAANITDASTRIAMFYVPEANLIVEGGRQSKVVGEGREVIEGKSVTLLCTVRADPPAYNITWLHNGRVVSMGGHRWRRDNTSLVITPVNRDDAGLYTCLASNSEGDGHSNAVLIRVAHTPYCSTQPRSHHFVVAVNTTITLSCEMEAVPKHLSFTWMLAASPIVKDLKGVGSSSGGVISGDRPLRRLPSLTDLTPGRRIDPTEYHRNTPTLRPWGVPLPASWEEAKEEDISLQGSLLRHRIDPVSPAKSQVTITPTVSAQVICYARNRVGRTKVPCTYMLNVVEPPGPLQKCNITGIGETRLEVKCDTHTHNKGSHSSDEATQLIQHSPSLSFVRSPEASARANLEVWSGMTLLANISHPRPEFSVRGLPVASPLKLVLYSATPHTRSAPVHLYARTLPRTTVHLTAAPHPIESQENEPSSKQPLDEQGVNVGFEVALVGVIGGLGLSMLILVVAIMFMRRRKQRRASLDEFEPPPDPIPDGSSQEILTLDVQANHSPPAESPTNLPPPVHTPPPPRLLTLRSEGICIESKEPTRNNEAVTHFGEGTSNQTFDVIDLRNMEASQNLI